MPGSDLYTGTLDTLILKGVSHGLKHGYATGRWIRQATDGALQINKGALPRRHTALNEAAGFQWVGSTLGERTCDVGSEESTRQQSRGNTTIDVGAAEMKTREIQCPFAE